MGLDEGAGIAEDSEMADTEGQILEKPRTESWWDMKPGVSGVVAKPYSHRLETDMPVPHPSLTQNSMESWIGTMLTLISQILGPEKWKSYKNGATTLLETDSKPGGERTHTYSDMTGLISNHDVVGYFHNDLARELNGRYADVIPIIEGLQPAGGLHITANEQAAIIKRIAQKWD
ncbi:hypothetical protein GRF29_44g2026122 [Pseudopithomyces chartarum]|uniref:Uncharacterized protein n=1 Tax=Pseudopithomyces chartarum TaxID=1892770 RepID=A0AAN6RI69_9PLEO|nr:hypothetical protein GRF29_44g2026122 [Pseudopithomyces chartarum]